MNDKIIFFIKIISLLIVLKISNKHFSHNNNKSDKYYNLSEFFFNKSEINDIHIYFRDLTYSFSFKYNMVEIRYNIEFYDDNRELLKPFDLTLFYNLNIICHMKYSINKEFNSLADIYQNKHFLCTHYFHIKDTVKKKLKFGVQIILEKTNYNYIYFFDYHLIKYKNKEENNTIFNPLVVNNEYLKFVKKADNNQYYGLKQFYIDKPNNIDIIQKDNIWTFKNFYNNYFCFCKGLCEYEYPEQFCKYLFYLYIIDKNKNMYNKTDYFLSDFFYTTSDDAFPIFKEMLKLKLNVHYIDSKKEI